jgi:methylated-DNA-protein-cysteine methyltransferase related protein
VLVAKSHARIFATIKRIPHGRVASYGQVAHEAGMPRHARLVGYALHRLPVGSKVPWHRVVNARGQLSLIRAGRASGIEQRLRLQREGVIVNAANRVSMRRYGWQPRGRRA